MNFSRRAFLRLGGATLTLAAASRAADESDGAFEFLVINDTHYLDAACRPWHARAIAAMRESAPRAALCLHAGDLTDLGTIDTCTAIRDLYAALGCPLHPVPGNHDWITDTDRTGYDAVFPGCLNYTREHAGWQLLALDTTQGTQFEATEISPATLAWLDEQTPQLDPRKPTFVFTHFPLGDGAEMRPVNADALITRLAKLNVKWVHSGHWHGESVRASGAIPLSTSRCCARIRGNRDGSPLKGWHIYRAAADGTLSRRFVSLSA